MFYNLYEVIAVDVENLRVEIDEKVIAKTEEQAKGKAGYFNLLSDREFDTDKLEVKVRTVISNIKEVEED